MLMRKERAELWVLNVYWGPTFSPSYDLFPPVFRIQIRIRIHMILGLPDPDPFVRGMDPDLAPDPDPSVIMQK